MSRREKILGRNETHFIQDGTNCFLKYFTWEEKKKNDASKSLLIGLYNSHSVGVLHLQSEMGDRAVLFFRVVRM